MARRCQNRSPKGSAQAPDTQAKSAGFGYAPPVLKRLLNRARRAAEERLPDEIVEAGRRVAAEVEHRIHDALGGPEAHPHEEPLDRDAQIARDIERAHERMKEEEHAQVIIYATDEEREDVEAIRGVFKARDEPVRVVNLAQDPRAFRNISGNTGVMVPPYVFIDGRFWGARYDIEALEAEGDIEKILSGELDQISDVARKIGHVHESFSDAMTVENIMDRLQRGHSLCIDDIDSWVEDEGDGPVLFHQGARIKGEAILETVRTIAAQIEAGEAEAIWRLEPEVKVG